MISKSIDEEDRDRLELAEVNVALGAAPVINTLTPEEEATNANVRVQTEPYMFATMKSQSKIGDGPIKEFLDQDDWPPGLQDALVKNIVQFPFRFFVCDNSGSMSLDDGHRMVTGADGARK